MSKYKSELSFDELIDYEMSINDSMDEESLKEYLNHDSDIKAILKEISIDLIKVSPAKENHLKDNKTQQAYNKQSDFSPILLSSTFEIIDGHHRYRASKFQKKDMILAYVIQY